MGYRLTHPNPKSEIVLVAAVIMYFAWKLSTARGMGYQGSPQGLLDAETNLKYAVKYLRGAYMVADGNQDAAVKWYSRGYYYEAKKKGLLQATGLR